MRKTSFPFRICVIFLLFGQAAGSPAPSEERAEIEDREERIQRLEEQKKRHERNRKIHLRAAQRFGAVSDLRLETQREYSLASEEKDRIDSLERTIRKLREEEKSDGK